MSINRKNHHHYDDVTLLVTHYNRSKSLERLLESFNKLEVSFREIVISDDGSQQVHLDYIEELKSKYNIVLVKTTVNKGLGNNLNKGQDEVRSPYTLYVQEDFVALEPFNNIFFNGLNLLKEYSEIDTVRFYSYLNYPKLKPFKDGFSEMIFEHSSLNIDKIPMYSDHPHLRRANFSEKFGRYPEGIKGDQTEYVMMLSFLKKKGRGLLFNDYKQVFDQINTEVEPSTMKRKFWNNSNNFFVRWSLYSYRGLKFFYSFYFKKV